MSNDAEHMAFEMAREMLGVDVLDDRLFKRIARAIELIDNVCGDIGGTLRSRQSVACIIVAWENSF